MPELSWGGAQVKVGVLLRVQPPSGWVGLATAGGRAWVSMRTL